MPITFLLLNSSQGTWKIKCFSIKLPCTEVFSLQFSLCLPFAHLHGCSGFLQCSAQGSSVLGPLLPQAEGMLKKIINKYKIYMKGKALSHHPHTTATLDTKATRKNVNLCCHANTSNSRKDSNQSAPILYTSNSCICLFLLFFLFCK